MVRHGVAKKRRRGLKVTRKAPKPIALKVANAVKDLGCKEVWDKTKTPAQNLLAMGLDPDPNTPKKDIAQYADKKGFIGMMEISETDPYATANPRRKQMSDFDQSYIQKCIAVHNNDFKKMERDVKTNYNQLTERQLEKMAAKYKSLRA